MQTRSTLWENLASSGNFILETKVVIGGTDYTEISAPIIDRALCKDTIEVGNCIAASLTVSIRTNDTFDRGAGVEVKKRLWDADRETYSEWITGGTFFISRREKDYGSGLISLTCYDAMLKGSENFHVDDPEVDLTGWPLPMADVVTYIVGRMGVQIDSRTVLHTESRYQITATPKGTLLDALGHIGACNGGNWIITPEGKLRLVKLTTAPTVRPDRVQFVTDIGDVYNRGAIVDDGGTEHYGDWVYQDGYIVLDTEDPDPTTDAEIAAILSRLGTSDAITITGISMTDDLESITYTAGTDTGYQLAIKGNPYSSQDICDDLLTALSGIVYRPFDAENAIYDPAAELGDPVIYKNIYSSVLMKERATMNIAFRGSIGAPANKEIEDEYPYKSQTQKNYEKAASMADDARKEAINYLSRDNSGMMIAQMSDENRYTPGSVPSGVKNTFIGNESFEVRDGLTSLASFGATSRIGLEGGARIEQSSSALRVVGADGANTVTMGAQSTATTTEEETQIIPAPETDAETGTITNSSVDVVLPYELSGQNITLTIDTAYTIPVGTAYSYTGTDYSIAYDGSYTVTITNASASDITATLQYQVTQPANYGITADTPTNTRLKARTTVNGTVAAEGGVYANYTGNFGIYDAKHALWMIVSGADGFVKIPSLIPKLLYAKKVIAPAQQYTWNSMDIQLQQWAVIVIRAYVNNISQYLLFFSPVSGSSQHISDRPSQTLYVRGGFKADWAQNKIYVRWTHGGASYYSTVFFDQVIGLIRK